MCDVCFQDSDYHLWVGADNEGLFELGIDGKRIRHYQPDGSSSSVASTVMCMYEDSNGDFWVGSYTRGLARMDRKTGKCDYLPQIGNKKVLSIAEDGRKTCISQPWVRAFTDIICRRKS